MPEPQIHQSLTKNSAPEDLPIPVWVCIVVLVGSLLMIVGAMIALVRPATLVEKGEEINAAVRVYAGYLFSRNLAIAVMLLFALRASARKALSTLMMLTALIQLLDALVDCLERRWAVLPVVFVIGLAFSIGANRTSKILRDR